MAILAAAVETKIYLQTLERNPNRNRQEELELARLWQKAAIPIRYFDPDLAQACLDRVGDWIQPPEWSSNELQTKRADIQEICGRIRSEVLSA
jgi:hypothetical protein